MKSFSFGKNWKDFLLSIDDDVIVEAGRDIQVWLGTKNIRGKSIIDIGSGSGLSSLCMYRCGCRRLVSFDYDSYSVEATKLLAKRAGSPDNWEIFQGSILDEVFIKRLGTFDIVHAWGVLHHTGNMWQAIDNAIRLCAPDGLVFISIYTGGDRYEKDLALKHRFNDADERTKREMILNQMRTSKPFYNVSGSPGNIPRDARGMTQYHDAIDWLGGLPYEVAHVSEVLLFGINRGLRPLKVFERDQGGCSVYLFKYCQNYPGTGRDTFEWSSTWSEKAEIRGLERQLSEDLKQARGRVQNLQNPQQLLKNRARRYFGIIRQLLCA
jgi:2-polyprenyl-6-hydroxyphenyl methylase/3-demethylubiquinone-9 3-methyltransferase